MNGLTINAETLLAALGLDVVYGVNVQMPPDRACWHVRFRVHGRLRNLSCGTSVEADALKRAAEIFASEVGRGSCEEDPVHQRLNKVESILEVLVARGASEGALVTQIKPRVEKTLAEALEAYHSERATRDSGGVVLCASNLSDIVPLENASMPGRVVVEWDKGDCEDLGLVKVDLLGLGMMAALEDAMQIAQSRGRPFDLATSLLTKSEWTAVVRGAEKWAPKEDG